MPSSRARPASCRRWSTAVMSWCPSLTPISGRASWTSPPCIIPSATVPCTPTSEACRSFCNARRRTAREPPSRSRRHAQSKSAEDNMSFKVHVGPPQIAIHQGQTVLVSEQDGQINWPSEKGLYFLDTRIVSNWAIYANGETWELLNGGAISYYASR